MKFGGFHEIWQISWMKTGRFHEIQQISCQILKNANLKCKMFMTFITFFLRKPNQQFFGFG